METNTPDLMSKLHQILLELTGSRGSIEIKLLDELHKNLSWLQLLASQEQAIFVRELIDALQRHDKPAFMELLEDWQATAEALDNTDFMQAWQNRHDTSDNIPWEQVRGELDVSGDPQG